MIIVLSSSPSSTTPAEVAGPVIIDPFLARTTCTTQGCIPGMPGSRSGTLLGTGHSEAFAVEVIFRSPKFSKLFRTATTQSGRLTDEGTTFYPFVRCVKHSVFKQRKNQLKAVSSCFCLIKELRRFWRPGGSQSLWISPSLRFRLLATMIPRQILTRLLDWIVRKRRLQH